MSDTALSSLLYGMRYGGPLYQEMYEKAAAMESLLASYQEVAAEARNWLAHDMFDAAALPTALSAAVARLDALLPAQADGE